MAIVEAIWYLLLQSMLLSGIRTLAVRCVVTSEVQGRRSMALVVQARNVWASQRCHAGRDRTSASCIATMQLLPSLCSRSTTIVARVALQGTSMVIVLAAWSVCHLHRFLASACPTLARSRGSRLVRHVASMFTQAISTAIVEATCCVCLQPMPRP